MSCPPLICPSNYLLTYKLWPSTYTYHRLLMSGQNLHKLDPKHTMGFASTNKINKNHRREFDWACWSYPAQGFFWCGVGFTAYLVMGGWARGFLTYLASFLCQVKKIFPSGNWTANHLVWKMGTSPLSLGSLGSSRTFCFHHNKWCHECCSLGHFTWNLKSQVNWCNASCWDHESWDSPLHMGPQVLSPKYEMATLFEGEAWDLSWELGWAKS